MCRKCGKLNHFANHCHVKNNSRKGKTLQRIGHISSISDKEVSDEADEYALFHTGNSDIFQSNTENQKLKYTCEVSINDQPGRGESKQAVI